MLVWSLGTVAALAVVLLSGKLDDWKEKSWNTAYATVASS